MRHLLFSFFLLLLLPSYPAFAATIAPDQDFTLQAPDGWEVLSRDFANLTHPSVAHVLDCVSDDPAELKQVGWKIENGKVFGAYCISYRKSGMRQAAVLLKYSKGKEHEDLTAKFVDTFAGAIHAGYAKRNITVRDMSADLLDAGDDIIMILDSRIAGEAGDYVRSATAFLHDDSLLNVGFIYNTSAPLSVREQLEAMSLSVKWK